MCVCLGDFTGISICRGRIFREGEDLLFHWIYPKTLISELDWANSAPTYPRQVITHTTCFDWVFSMVPLLYDIILRENIINHLYKNLSNSIYNIFILKSKIVSADDVCKPKNFAHKNFAQCQLYPQELCPQGTLLTRIFTGYDVHPQYKFFLPYRHFHFLQINQSLNHSINQSILHLNNNSGYI